MPINKSVPDSVLNQTATHDWSKIYELACKELGIQQEKRDKVINLYLVLCGIIIAFFGNAKTFDQTYSGLMFLLLAIVGMLFTCIVVRYRVYKEVHWITCSTITKLPYLKPSQVNKENVQGMFWHSLYMKGKKYMKEKDEKKVTYLSRWLFFKKNCSSAETFSFVIIAFLSVVMLGLGLYLLMSGKCYALAVSVGTGLLVFVLLILYYMIKLFKVYKCLDPKLSETKQEELFNPNFEKAWFLHVYYEDPTKPAAE